VAAGNRDSDEPIARSILDRLISLGLRYRRTADGRRQFDLFEVQNFIKFAYFEWGELTWPVRAVSMLRRLMSDAIDSAETGQPPDLRALRPRRFEATILRSFNLEGHQTGDRIRLRLPLPIEDETLGEIKTEFIAPVLADVETRAAPARMDVWVRVPTSRQVSLGVKTAFTAYPRRRPDAATIETAEAALYMRHSEGLIKVTDRVYEVACRVGGTEKDPGVIVSRFWDFMFDELTCGCVHYDLLNPRAPLDSVLDQRCYNCQLGSALLAALCRARGIPARLVSGYTLNPILPTTHTWLEVWLAGRGWAPFDLYSIELCGGDRGNAWRHYFFGQIDHRLVVERPPLLFSGSGAVRLPTSWLMVSSLSAPGVRTDFENLDTGALVYTERVIINKL
jgi:hypothetical protein